MIPAPAGVGKSIKTAAVDNREAAPGINKAWGGMDDENHI